MPHNIEKSAFRRGEYVGYGAGFVWRIVRYGRDGWSATGGRGADWRIRKARTLALLSEKIAT